ncbi:hypothetical protein IJ384_03655 [bacterium]|nr:hypothetical protein [bacterium]
MIGGVTNFLTSSTLSSISQNTAASVSIETGLKSIGRPAFILADKKIEPQTKRYAAMKEFLYQATCLATYMAIIIPVFKNGSFKLAKKIFKEEECFKLFKNTNHYLNYRKIASMNKNDRVATLGKEKYKNMFSKEIKDKLMTTNNPEAYNLAKGVIECSNIIGSVLGLAIFAPQVSHLIVHPVLKFIGMEKDEQSKTKTN